ncbi:hypothetical protein FS749_005851 [Ceratobasidium sp. UAMH 11750]|nr:hypothetical protein FS749_005851 [Ceratobasidium sp. UAMH 11750]
MWTIGAQPFGSSRNNRNWYSRSRGLHQLALLRLQFGTGNESQNLDKAIGVLSDVRLRKALQELAAGSGQDIDLLRKSCCTSRSSTNKYAILRDYRAELEEHFGSYDRGIREFHKAWKSLKDYVTPYSDEPDHSLSTVPQEYPVLSLVTSNHFWSQAPVLSWIFGWNTQVKRFQDVNSALGWALLAKRMEPMFEDLMHQSRPARHVLAVAKDLSTKRGHALWWQRLGLSLLSHGYPSPPASEVDEHSGSVASGEADHGIANGAEEDVAPPPGRPSDGAPPGARQNEGSQAPSIENSENEHEVGRDRTRDDTPAAPDKRGALASPRSSRTPVQPSAPPPSPRRSQPRSWQEDSQPEEPWQAGSPPTAISTRTQRFSPSPIPADPATVPTHQFFESRVPGHVLTRHCRSHNTLESLISESSHNPSLSVSQLHRAIKLHETKVETLLPAIALERQKLRETIIAYAEPCVKAPYGAFVANTALSPLLFQIKNIYVANVALLLQSHLEMTLEEALNEAAAIATFDGLYTTEIKEFHAEGRGLELNLRATFCQSYQDEAAPDATITLGTLPDCSKDRKKMIGALGYFHAPLGPGRTEAESCARGIDSATLVLSKFARRKCPYLQVHIAIHPPATEDRPPVDCSVPWDDLVHSTNDPISRWQATKHELSERPVPNAAEQCWLSTGRLAPIEHISEAKLARGDTGLAARLQQVVRTSLQHWAETQHADIVAHRSFMAMRDGRNGLSVPPYSASDPHGASPVASRGHSSLNLHSAELSGPRDAKLNPVRGQPRSGPTPVTPHRLRSDFAGPGHPPPATPPSRGLGARSPLHTPDPQEESDGEYSSHDESESYRRQRRALNQTALRPMDEQESDTEYISSSESTS